MASHFPLETNLLATPPTMVPRHDVSSPSGRWAKLLHIDWHPYGSLGPYYRLASTDDRDWAQTHVHYESHSVQFVISKELHIQSHRNSPVAICERWRRFLVENDIKSVVYWGGGIRCIPTSGFVWQRILTSVIINKQGTFRPFATPVCVYPPPIFSNTPLH